MLSPGSKGGWLTSELLKILQDEGMAAGGRSLALPLPLPVLLCPCASLVVPAPRASPASAGALLTAPARSHWPQPPALGAHQAHDADTRHQAPDEPGRRLDGRRQRAAGQRGGQELQRR